MDVSYMLDGLDRRILEMIQGDGRISNTALAESVGLSPSPCLRRVKRLEELGYITRYRAVLSREHLGLSTTVLVGLKVDILREKESEELRRAIHAMPEIVAAHFVSGEFDFVLEVVVPSLEHFERFLIERLLKLPMIKDIRSNVVIRTMKLDGELSLEHLEETS